MIVIGLEYLKLEEVDDPLRKRIDIFLIKPYRLSITNYYNHLLGINAIKNLILRQKKHTLT